MLVKIEGRRRRGRQKTKCLGGLTDSMDISWSKLQEIGKDKEAWHGAVHALQRIKSNFATEHQQ